MRQSYLSTLLIAGLLTSAGCANAREEQTAPPAQAETVWRTVAPENLVILQLEAGDVIIELNDEFAPNHAAQFRKLANDGVYDGESFYRVIDGFVAQGGLETDERAKAFPTLINENDRPLTLENGEPRPGFAPLNGPDLFAPEVGHRHGFAVGRSEELGQEWLLHCPGALAMARDEDPDSGGTDFYIVLDAQRYLDRNLTVFGRVLSGMQWVQALNRGDPKIDGGVIQAPDKGDTILSIRTASAPNAAAQISWQVMETPSAAFEDFKTAKRVRNEAFFYRHPPEVLDICAFSTPAREKLQTTPED